MKAKQAKRELKKLYDLIPSFECIPGCTDCCGPVPAIALEKERAPKLEQASSQLEQFVDSRMMAWCTTCPYAVAGHGCAVYDNRPMLCRMFGTSEEQMLTCTHGCGSKRKFTRAETTRILNRYLDLATPADRADFARMHEAWMRKYDLEPELPREEPIPWKPL